jgi:hypothetical protein
MAMQIEQWHSISEVVEARSEILIKMTRCVRVAHMKTQPHEKGSLNTEAHHNKQNKKHE